MRMGHNMRTLLTEPNVAAGSACLHATARVDTSAPESRLTYSTSHGEGKEAPDATRPPPATGHREPLVVLPNDSVRGEFCSAGRGADPEGKRVERFRSSSGSGRVRVACAPRTRSRDVTTKGGRLG